ncbi:MAG: Asp-tRNA(Asn)/Glu-tRNA(Gln) amidotransferase subunit GatC [Burkholderiaceae bacterium]
MALTLDEVHRIAHLARLAIDGPEAEHTRARLNEIFTLIEQMQAVDTTGVEPMTHAEGITLRLRADEVTESDLREAYQAVAPAVADGLYLVPKVIE